MFAAGNTVYSDRTLLSVYAQQIRGLGGDWLPDLVWNFDGLLAQMEIVSLSRVQITA